METGQSQQDDALSINRKAKEATENTRIQETNETMPDGTHQNMDEEIRQQQMELKELSNQSTSITIPAPDEPHTPHKHDRGSSDSIEEVSTIAPINITSTPIKTAAQLIHTTTSTRSSFVGNLYDITHGIYDRTPCPPDVMDETNREKHIEKRSDSTSSKTNNDDDSSSTSYFERNKNDPSIGDQVDQTKQLTIQVNANKTDRHSSTITHDTEITEKVKSTPFVTPADASKTVAPIISKKDSSCSIGNSKCLMFFITISGLVCIGFGIYDLSVDSSSLRGWLLVGLPIACFIFLLLLRHCLKKQTNVTPSENCHEATNNDKKPDTIFATATI
jgi:hypothetical protein